MKPEISVIIPVQSQDPDIFKQSLESIINQERVTIEIIIIDDCSKLPVSIILKNYIQKNNIRIIRNNKVMGVARSLNRGISISKGKYIARMDSDDISLPLRLYKQKDFLDKNPDIKILGTWVEVFGNYKYTRKTADSPDKNVIQMIFRNSLAHPSVMYRKEIKAIRSELYNPKYETAEDYELWTQFLEGKQISNLREVLLKYRSHNQQVGSRRKIIQDKNADKVRELVIIKLVKDVSRNEISLHNRIAKYSTTENDSAIEIVKWLYKVHAAILKNLKVSKVQTLVNYFEEIYRILKVKSMLFNVKIHIIIFHYSLKILTHG